MGLDRDGTQSPCTSKNCRTVLLFRLDGMMQLNPGFQLAQSQSLAPKSAVILLKTID